MKINKLIIMFCATFILSISVEPSFAISSSMSHQGDSSFKSNTTKEITNHQLKKKKKKKKKKNPCRSISSSEFFVKTNSRYPVIYNYTKCDVKFELIVSRCEASESMDCLLDIWNEYDYFNDWVPKNSSLQMPESYGKTNIGTWDGYYYDFELNILRIAW